jgi:hypothetical protein
VLIRNGFHAASRNRLRHSSYQIRLIRLPGDTSSLARWDSFGSRRNQICYLQIRVGKSAARKVWMNHFQCDLHRRSDLWVERSPLLIGNGKQR